MRSEASNVELSIELVVMSVGEEGLSVLLERDEQGTWMIPSSEVSSEESADRCAELLLSQALPGSPGSVRQFYTFAEPARAADPRRVSIAYYAFASLAAPLKRAASWIPVARTGTLKLSGYHRVVLERGVRELREREDPVLMSSLVLPALFTLTELQHVFEALVGRAIDKRNFRAKLLKSGLARPTDEYRTGYHRPARLYSFVPEVRARSGKREGALDAGL